MRSAWTLNGAAPPTFPDRLRGGAPEYRIEIDPASGARALADCAPGPLQTRLMARWPAGLEPWLTADLRVKSLPPDWLASCAHHGNPEAGLKIVGIADGAVLRRSRDADAALLRLEVRGHRGEVLWLVNGKVVARRAATASLLQKFEQPGRYDITVMDDAGRFDRVSVSLR